MLRYLGHGRRRFGLFPMYIHRRGNWEFFAVLQGQCAAVLPGAGRPGLQTRRIWIFPPAEAHGWIGQVSKSCRVAVFHFDNVPELLEKATRERGYLNLPLTAVQARWLARLGDELQPHYKRMTAKSLLVFDRALLDLTLLALESLPLEHTEITPEFASRKVEAAITWYCEHMAQQPKFEEAAQAVNISSRHLRRLFHEVRQESPQAAFTKLRVQRAMELLSQTDRKLDDVVAACGFSSSSDFCRVFKSHRKISPDTWRRRVLRGYSESGVPN